MHSEYAIGNIIVQKKRTKKTVIYNYKNSAARSVACLLPRTGAIMFKLSRARVSRQK